ncbi:hypothetical protein ABXV18_06565 [Vibrio owensii]|uniref:hypothetical protein n=1 Tax=Vibrio owensii TaxID=696485 RepID=UPI00339B26AC
METGLFADSSLVQFLVNKSIGGLLSPCTGYVETPQHSLLAKAVSWSSLALVLS